jgi:hypothetical protein
MNDGLRVDEVRVEVAARDGAHAHVGPAERLDDRGEVLAWW